VDAKAEVILKPPPALTHNEIGAIAFLLVFLAILLIMIRWRG